MTQEEHQTLTCIEPIHGMSCYLFVMTDLSELKF